ncbi:MAG: cob(I)yrinic acid a,c-diamide adenosyltransferase [Microbacteriaceae bacterium]|nr:cob(I)yrinic acid a,c-diamide adenosyltransferase [Microbacteriaceae bacterium]
MSRVYTKTGDDGTTGQLFGGRISKGSELVEALGDIDEAVSALGVARAECNDDRMAGILLSVQREMFIVGADLSVNPQHRDRLKPGVSLVESGMVSRLEDLIDELTEEQPLEPVFLVPGTTPLEAKLDFARTVVRRAERHTLRAKDAGHPVSEHAQRYLNRLSDLVFVLARRAVEGAAEPVSHD